MKNQKINWKNILIGVVIVTVLIVIGVLVYFFLRPYSTPPDTYVTGQDKQTTNSAKKDETAKDTTNNTQTTKTTTSCASTLTDSDKIMIETWKTYENTTHNYSFKYPENWAITANEDDIVSFTDEADKTSFEFVSGTSGGSTDGLEKTSEKESTIACEKATVQYYEAITPITGGHDRYITANFKKDGTWYMIDVSYEYIGASLSSDIVEAYDLILKTIEFK